ncbi:hypothetical protein [Nitratireductor rhodophyticola]|uniref:hypothetical protein n=1 Tax=Nitratireductor rhodophyticola TaxID=2854036 RepID=UPI00300A7AD0
MNISELSDNGLLSLHAGVAKALAADDATPPGQEKPYGAREYADWKAWGDALEVELRRRQANFNEIDWSERK